MTIALTCFVIRSSIILTCTAASNCCGACHSNVTPSALASSSPPIRQSSKKGWTPLGTMATVMGDPSLTIFTVERRPASNGSAQAAAGVASCAKADNRDGPPSAAMAAPAADPATSARRLSGRPSALLQMLIDLHLLSRLRIQRGR
jgi:hypothetical protein